MSGIYIPGAKIPDGDYVRVLMLHKDGTCVDGIGNVFKVVPVPPHGNLKKRVVYRGDVFNALESARIIALDGILTDRYKDGFHDGLKRALEILANEVQDIPTIIPASEEET